MKKVISILIIASLLSGCLEKTAKKNANVKCYKVANTATSNTDDWIYYYLIFHNNGSYYYYSSPIYYTSIPSDASWTSSSVSPISQTDFQSINSEQPLETINEPLTDLPNEIEVDMETTTDSPTETDNSPSDGGSGSDSGGSSDSGGGDSGGGSSGE